MNVSIKAPYMALQLAYVTAKELSTSTGTYEGKEALPILDKLVELTAHTMDGELLQAVQLGVTETFADDEIAELVIIIEENHSL